MRYTILAGLTLAALAAVPAAAAPAPSLLLPGSSLASLASLPADAQQGVQVWMDGRREIYRPGERMRVRVRTERDGYLAVFHIDTNGDVDIIYPQHQDDDGWVEGGRNLSFGSRGGYDYLQVNGGQGMGYVMAVMLEEPMELWRVRDFYRPRTADWDSDRTIWGDPFYAMDEIVRTVVPEGWQGYESVDHTTYHIGRRYRYPRYACYDGYGPWYHRRGVYWDDCDRVRVVLVNYPYYYDAYRWRHPRRAYYERYYYRAVPIVRNRPLHGYKERTDSYAPPTRSSAQRRPAPDRTRDGSSSQGSGVSSRNRRPTPDERPTPSSVRGREGSSASGSSRPATRSGGSVRSGGGDRPATAPRSGPADSRPARGPSSPQRVQDDDPPQQDRPVQPSRERPTFQRRPSEPTRSATPRRETPPSRSAEPRREAAPPARSAEPRRESPPPQRSAEPRRESPPPQRSAEPRRESPPPQRSAEPRREAPPQRESRPSRSSSPPSREN